MTKKFKLIDSEMNEKIILLLLFFILLVGFILRYESIWFGYPLITHPDEPTLVYNATRMLKNLDFNPHFFNYPSLIIYLQVFVQSVVGGFEHYIMGIPIEEIQRVHLFVAGRLVATIAAVASIYTIYIIARKLGNEKIGLLAAFIVSISPLHIKNSAFVTTDIWVAIFLVYILFYSIKIYEDNKISNYIIAGVFVGLAMSSKYTAFVFFTSVLTAHLLSNSFNYKYLIERKIIVSGLVAVSTFLLTTPYAIIDFKTFIKHVLFESHHYRTGHSGAEAVGNTSWHLYLDYLVSTAGVGYIVVILALIGIAFALQKKYRIFLIVVAPLLLFIFVGGYKVYFPRNIVSIIPVLAILASLTSFVIIEFFRQKYKFNSNIIYLLIGLMILLNILGKAIDDVKQRNLEDTRWVSIKWIKDNIPNASRVACEAYTTPIHQYDKRLKKINLGLFGIYKNNHKIDESVQYVIASSGNYGRFFDKYGKPKEQYLKEAKFYLDFFANHKLIYELKAEKGSLVGPTIRIFRN